MVEKPLVVLGLVAGLLVIKCGVQRNVIRFLAPLVTSEPQLAEAMTILDGALARAAAHPETQQILEICDALYEESGGIFDAWHAGRDGGLEPAGYVKGWAIGVAGAILRDHGVDNFSLGIGGDITAAGGGPAGIGWSVGVVDPQSRTSQPIQGYLNARSSRSAWGAEPPL